MTPRERQLVRDAVRMRDRVWQDAVFDTFGRRGLDLDADAFVDGAYELVMSRTPASHPAHTPGTLCAEKIRQLEDEARQGNI